MYLVVPRQVRKAPGLGFDMSSFAGIGSSLISMIPGMDVIGKLPLATEIIDVGTKLGAGYLTNVTTKVDTTAADTAALTQFVNAQQSQAAAAAAQQASIVAAQQESAKRAADQQRADQQAAQKAALEKQKADQQFALEQQRISLQQQLVQAQQQGNAAQVAQLQSALTQLPAPTGMSTGTMLAIAGGVSVVSILAVVALTGRR
jgi:multidrug efflux pump subunit AcrA (membrane-fusion protein)